MPNTKQHILRGLLYAFVGVQASWAVFLPQPLKSNSKRSQKNLGPEFVPGEYVVKFRRGVALASQSTQLGIRSLGFSIQETLNSQEHLVLVKSHGHSAALRALSPEQISARIASLPEVEYAEANFIYHAQQESIQILPDDAKFSEQWSLQNTGQVDSEGGKGVLGADIRASRAWTLGTGSKDVVVAVIDTGVNYRHPELRANLWSRPKASGETAAAEVYGFNAINGQLDPMDDNGHGSHCAGVIGALPNNGLGIAGLNWNVRLMGVKFLNSSGGGTLADAVKAIDWAVANGADILSNSWGGGPYSQAIFEAIDRARTKGILFVAAAGNESSDDDKRPSYPASYALDNIVAVAATNNKDELSAFSNYGKASVHLAAPGENILSTTLGEKYESMSGTSMAAPHVAGAAALLLARESQLTPQQVRTRLMDSSDKIPTLRRKVVSGGRLNIYSLLAGLKGPSLVEVPEGAWSAIVEHLAESAHPYPHSTEQEWVIEHPGAHFMRLRFEKFSMEEGYDQLQILNKAGEVVDTLSGTLVDGTWSEAVAGDKVTLRLKTDNSVAGYGFRVNSYSWSEFVSPLATIFKFPCSQQSSERGLCHEVMDF